jgi:hypothetical protein
MEYSVQAVVSAASGTFRSEGTYLSLLGEMQKKAGLEPKPQP